MESKTLTIALILVAMIVIAENVFATESADAPSPATLDAFQKCAGDLGATCGGVISKYVFENGVHVSKECCTALLEVGEDCHELLTEVTIVYKRLYPAKKAKQAWYKNNQVWQLCKKNGQVSN